jgi:hypothetical protein
MGAYEGAYDALPAMALNEDVDEHDIVVLVPTGVLLEPLEQVGAIFLNVAGPDDSTASLAEPESEMHPAAEGYGFAGTNVALETSIDDGAFLAVIHLPFTVDDLDGVDPMEVDVTSWDAETGNWALAVSRNASMADLDTVGARHAVAGPEDPGTMSGVGSYGVYWSPSEQRGYAWANVDHGGDFALGAPICRADALQPPDGHVGMVDLIAVLWAWGDAWGPHDVTFNGVVDFDDVVALLAAWGACGG